MSNRLAAATSPYLRQHADNPVDWYPWGEEAFARARHDDKPILLSIGYSSCHWCHVMAHESFEDAATAALMNELFVNVKVDREERPDVDAVYMEAAQRLTGRGGWPLTAFLTPSGEPFFAGTYFPPEDRHGMPSFTRVCEAIADVWQNRRAEADAQAAQLRDLIEESTTLGADAEAGPSVELLDHAARTAIDNADRGRGGFGGAPKFPQAMTLDFLLQHHLRTGDPDALAVVRLSLDHMCAGGVYDHVGGGFHRYSVDARWLVPHFEKMLYDQALLVRAYLHGHLVTGEPRYRRVVEETVEYVLRDLRHANGGFFSAEDADSEGMEGAFYVWTLDEFRTVCGADADAAAAAWGVTEAGNFHDPTGHAPPRTNILHFVDVHQELTEPLERARAALFRARGQRVRPGLDDKILLAWNAWFLDALTEAATALDRPDWMEAARANARFLLDSMRRPDGRFVRAWNTDTRAYAEDHAALIGALCTLAERDSLDWLADAVTVAEALEGHYADPTGGWFTTADDAEALIVRPKDLVDDATPSANSSGADALFRLAVLTGDSKWETRARGPVERLMGAAARFPTSFANLLIAAQRAVLGPIELVVTGAGEPAEPLTRTMWSRLVPAAVQVHAERADDRSPLLAGRAFDGAATAYVCENYTCRAPVSRPEEFDAEIDAALARR